MDFKKHMLWWDVLKIFFGTLVTSFAFRYFTFPNNIVAGGITGISQIINLLTGFPIGVATIAFNVPLFIWAWRRLGRRFVILTGLCMVVSSVTIDLLEPIARPLTTDPMLAAVYGGVFKGAGYGIVYTTGATSGGVDIPARILRRQYPYINFSTFSLGMNAVIIVAFAVIFRRFDSCMYTLICMYISSKLISLILYGPINSRLCYIISERSDELEARIPELLETVQQGLYEKAKANLDSHTFPAFSLEEAKALQEEKGGCARSTSTPFSWSATRAASTARALKISSRRIKQRVDKLRLRHASIKTRLRWAASSQAAYRSL